MKLFFRIILSALLLFVISSVIFVAVLNWAGTKVVNAFLNLSVNAPAKVEKFETNWLLTEMVVENLQIYNPEGFPKGKLLEVEKLWVNLYPLYTFFKPYTEIEIQNGHLNFIRREDNATNVAVAFKIPYEKAKVKPLTFEVEKLNAKLYVEPLEKNINYTAKGIFKGLGNNAKFEIKGYGNFGSKETVTDFTVYNWNIRNNPVLSTLAEILNEPKLKELTLSKIEGKIETKGDWIIFPERDTKAFVINDVLFAIIHKGSKYNLKTKEINATITLYSPLKVTVKVSGTSESPEVEILNLKSREIEEKIKTLGEKVFQNLLNKVLSTPSTQ